ncbi:hypothetical protein cje28_08904 [Campylobacter jejuni subsp. jejuni 51037]|nr:hypothetical protein cje10_08791 [Campylobacter jejuni subsp. jejuni 51494]EIB54918.1 hypothetical protein cje160_06930 [Campylobacter jejuni subsp. jejuni 2008-979]EIB61922.1 hypothetical protein cje22_08479 [Campylobacter jejuni subsp. jejuni 1997-10]EIB66066.1 hypothetical protein cje25_05742 [Campylobacter jejuni subsp. jejuni 1997-14]EIB67576.1 hypothetical protein cje28_08904 [Campylobacter jejuni subsp. jejuni 51037]
MKKYKKILVLLSPIILIILFYTPFYILAIGNLEGYVN